MNHIPSAAAAADSFSWHRVAAVMHLMWPRLRTTAIAYAATGIISAILIYAMTYVPMGFKVMSLITIVPSSLMLISPVFVAGAIGARQLTSLPALSSEKYAAMILYVVALGLLAFALPQVMVKSSILSSADIAGPELGPSLDYIRTMPVALWILNVLSSWCPVSVCLVAIICRPGKRWFAIGMTVVTLVVQAIFGGIYGGIQAFMAGYRAATRGDAYDYIAPEELTAEIFKAMTPFMWIYCLVCILLMGLFVYLGYRRLATRQL